MKKPPYPDNELKTVAECEKYVIDLTYNSLSWLRIDGYNWYIANPKDKDFVHMEGSGFVITTTYPYKKFHISLQQDSIDKMIGVKKNSEIWVNIEKSILHETFHLLLSRLVAQAHKRFLSPNEVTDHEEYVIDHLVGVFYPLLSNHRDKNKKS